MDRRTVPAWVALALREVSAMTSARVALVVVSPGAAEPAPAAVRAYLGADRRVFGLDARVCDTTDLVDVAPMVDLGSDPAATESYQRALTENRVDTVIDFTQGGSTALERVTPRLGTWRLSHAGTSATEAAVWSVLKARTTVRSVMHSVEARPRVLVESTSRADHLSVSRALNLLLWKSLALMTRGIRRLDSLSTSGSDALPPLVWDGPVRGHDVELVWRAVRHVGWAGFRQWRLRSLRRPWILLRGRRDALGAISEINRVLPPDGSFWADPCLVAHEGQRYLFFEDYRYDRGFGHISVAPIDADGQMGPPLPVVEPPYHVSHPFVFQHESAWYLIPETRSRRAIELYRCERFPDRWTFSHNLISDVTAVDATLLNHDGRWWMFANIAEYQGSSSHDELFAFWSDSPVATSWHPHPLNPVVSDVRRARSAGSFLSEGGRLIRPSQDCAKEYGRAVCLNEVVTLSEQDYQERCIGILEANWDPEVVAMHTLAELDDLVFMDGKLEHPIGQPLRQAGKPGRCQMVEPRFAT